MTLGATYYVVGVTMLAVAFPTLMARIWIRYSARPRPVPAKANRPRRTHAAGAPNAS